MADAEEIQKMHAEVAALDWSTEESQIKIYNEAAVDNKYDKYLVGNYIGPVKCADAINRYHQGDRNASILDVGAGTGLVGEELQKLGFKRVDALDPVQALLDIAEKKGVYSTFFNEFFTDNIECLPTDGYDVLVVCGVFTMGHVKCAVLPEMVRCTKPGGIVVIGMREDFLFKVEEYKDRLEPAMKRLEDEGKWQKLERTVIPKWAFEKSGVVSVFRVK